MPTSIAYLYSDPRLETAPVSTIWGWEIERVYQDLALPQTRHRPQLQQLIADATIAPPNYLLVRTLDELGDTLTTVGDCLARLESLGITVITTEQDYHSSAAGISAQAQLMLLAQVQHNQRSRRIRQGHAQKRIKGLLPPGRAPYGYRRSKDRYVLDRSTAPVVKEFFERFIVYGSLRGAVRHLEKRYGKKIAPSTGRRWLENPVYRGDTGYQDGRIVPNTHPAMISREEAAQVDRLLRRNRQLPPKTASAPRSLAGLVSCATCSSTLKISRVTTRGKSREYLYLRSTDCPQHPKCKAIAYETALSRTIDTICVELPKAVTQLPLLPTAGMKADLSEQMQHRKTLLGQLPELIKTGVLDQQTADLRAYLLHTELADLRQKQAALPPVNLQELTQAVAIPQFWQDLSEAERRFFFREFIDQILIHRGSADWTLKIEFIF